MSRRRKAKAIAALVCSVFIVVMCAVAFGMMINNTGEKMLQVYGLENLKFFTVLSNLLLGVVSAVYAACTARALARARRNPEDGWRIPPAAQIAKFVGTTAAALTFLTVMVFLGPLFGYEAMFLNANLWFHLVLPVVGIVEFALLDAGPRLGLRHTAVAVVPTIIYGTCYLANVVINGVGEWPNLNDWYGFAMWGIPAGIGIFAAIALAT